MYGYRGWEASFFFFSICLFLRSISALYGGFGWATPRRDGVGLGKDLHGNGVGKEGGIDQRSNWE